MLVALRVHTVVDNKMRKKKTWPTTFMNTKAKDDKTAEVVIQEMKWTTLYRYIEFFSESATKKRPWYHTKCSIPPKYVSVLPRLCSF